MGSVTDVDIRKTIEGSVKDVFDTMLSMEVEPGQPDLEPSADSNRYVACVKFAGEMVGIVNIQLSWEFAQIMTASMLGIETEEIESQDEVKDLIAELSNIIGGKLKSSYTDVGLYCELSPPSITVGHDFTIKSLNMETYELFTFLCQGHVILVEAGVKQGSAESAELKASKTKGKRRTIDIEQYRELDMKQVIVNSAIDVFETMLSMNAEQSESVDQSSLEGVRTVGSVGFAGDITGIINIHVSNEFARTMTASMLGMDETDIEGQEEINDLIGEISNIIGGGLKSTYTDIGLICELSTPSITTGSDFMIESLNMTTYDRFAFRVQEHHVFVEVGVKVSESLQPVTRAGKDIHYDVNEDNVAGSEADAAQIEMTDKASPAPPQQDETGQEQKVPAAQSEIPAEDPEPYEKQDEIRSENPATAEYAMDMDVILDVPLEITVELGRTRIPIHELLQLGPGSAVSLSRLEREPVDVLANDTLIAKGVVVVQDEKYGIQLTELTSRMERLRSLG